MTKRPAGRPLSGVPVAVTLNVRVPPEVLAWLDTETLRLGMVRPGGSLNRSEVVRAILASARMVAPDPGRYAAERAVDGPVQELTLSTKVPSKWLVIDRETGDQWEWRDRSWVAAR